MEKCKNCRTEGNLELIKDYQYQFEEDSPIEIIDVLKCSVCGCIHWETSTNSYYQFYGKNHMELSEATSGWATSHK